MVPIRGLGGYISVSVTYPVTHTWDSHWGFTHTHTLVLGARAEVKMVHPCALPAHALPHIHTSLCSTRLRMHIKGQSFDACSLTCRAF